MALEDVQRHQEELRARERIRQELADAIAIMKARHREEMQELTQRKFNELRRLALDPRERERGEHAREG